MPINKTALHSILATGGGYSQLREFYAGVDMHCMSNKTFLKHMKNPLTMQHYNLCYLLLRKKRPSPFGMETKIVMEFQCVQRWPMERRVIAVTKLITTLYRA
ncbi:hypothetical protein PR048_019000 [Dryococelus australis]|uniref:Uncharacterized protein n=1 Tax=Dryococelus australis TaxID=614101 RepID=A0ABQ9H2D8_9NEOP|nr:hypothetical protein PR048_019000 [Dryococelus australis]